MIPTSQGYCEKIKWGISYMKVLWASDGNNYYESKQKANFISCVNNVTINIDMHVSHQNSVLIYIEYIPRSGITGSYSWSIFNF